MNGQNLLALGLIHALRQKEAAKDMQRQLNEMKEKLDALPQEQRHSAGPYREGEIGK